MKKINIVLTQPFIKVVVRKVLKSMKRMNVINNTIYFASLSFLVFLFLIKWTHINNNKTRENRFNQGSINNMKPSLIIPRNISINNHEDNTFLIICLMTKNKKK